MNKTNWMTALSVVVALMITGGWIAEIRAQEEGGKKPGRQDGGRFNRDSGQRGGEGRLGGPNGGRMQGGNGSRNMMAMLPIMIALDANKDGTISEQEIKNASQALMALDKNNNRQLDPDELRPSSPQMGQGGQRPGQGGQSSGMMGAGNFDPGQMVQRMFKQNDKDGDGKLSADEVPERMSQAMERMDSNGDGTLEKSEVEEFLKNRSGGQRPGRGGSGESRDSQGTVPKRPSDK